MREQGPKGSKWLITCHVLRTLRFFFRRKGKGKEASTETVHELPRIVYMICCSPFSFFLSFLFSLFLHFWLSFFLCLSFHLISLFSFVLLEKEQRESLTFSAKRERLCYMHRKVRTILCYLLVLFFVPSPYGPSLISGTRSV